MFLDQSYISMLFKFFVFGSTIIYIEISFVFDFIQEYLRSIIYIYVLIKLHSRHNFFPNDNDKKERIDIKIQRQQVQKNLMFI